jgi:hypothetical protein
LIRAFLTKSLGGLKMRFSTRCDSMLSCMSSPNMPKKFSGQAPLRYES